jgi:hypothetical protein
MIYGKISLNEIIAKVYADLDLQESTYPISDFIEWSAEALKKIGAFPSFENKVAGKGNVDPIRVTNYQALLPCELHSIQQVAFSTNSEGPYHAMRHATGTFDNERDLDNSDTSNVTALTDLVFLAMDLYDLEYESAIAKINSEPTTKASLSALLNSRKETLKEQGTDFSIDYTYTLTSRYIKTNVRDGYLMMAYQSIPIDSDGYPLIPNDEGFKEALYWYIVKKLLYPKWAKGQVRDTIYFHAQSSWNYYSKQAYGNALMPNQDQLESIKNIWTRLVPNINAHNTFYSTIGQQEKIYNQNSR